MLFLDISQLSGEVSAVFKSCSIPCEPITILQCTSQSYSMIGFPNFFNQTSQTGADDIAHNIDVAEAAGCSDQTTKFLCGLLLPECRENEGLVLPTRQTCKEFYAGCGILLLQLTGYEELIYDCEEYFSENPEPICPSQYIVPSTDEATTMSTLNTEIGKYLIVDIKIYTAENYQIICMQILHVYY